MIDVDVINDKSYAAATSWLIVSYVNNKHSAIVLQAVAVLWIFHQSEHWRIKSAMKSWQECAVDLMPVHFQTKYFQTCL